VPANPDLAAHFRALHSAPEPLLLPNPWDAGSARLLASLGFRARATTSSGFAMTLGRRDGQVTRDEALEHAALIVGATELPVSADLENCFGADAGGVAETTRLAAETGLAGCSIEDYSGNDTDSIYQLAEATDRVRAAAEAAHAANPSFTLTGRAENYLHGRPDLADTIARLQAYQEAGADVLYAPGLADAGEIRSVVSSVDRPVNVLAFDGVPTGSELAEMGVRRISVGGAFAYAALGAVVTAARELLDHGTYGYGAATKVGRQAVANAFS
jgi:2-methylisocitrate lyase-like PEP mutase family enzyme